jgi:transposase
VSDPARTVVQQRELRSYANVCARAKGSAAHATLAYAVRLYPTAIKAWALSALCDFYRRQFNQQLDWCAEQESLSLKGLKQADTGEFIQRTKRQAIIAFKRSAKAEKAIRRNLPYEINRLVRSASRTQINHDHKKAKRLLERAENTAHRLKHEPKPPYLHAILLPHVETQATRRAHSFDGWLHIEATGREWQIYLPYRRHKAINRVLGLPGAQLATSAEVFHKNGKWYARLFVNVRLAQPHEPQGWLGVDVGARNAVVRSDGYKGRDLRPIIRIEKTRRAAQQRDDIHKSKGLSYKRQVLNKEARKIVSVAQKAGLGLALEDPKRLVRWKQHAARWLANRVALLASLADLPVRLVNPAYTSATCSDCGSRETYRQKQYFHCHRCGLTLHADRNAARNIRLAVLTDSGRRREAMQARVA